MSDKAKYAYLAGIIDGEGCITIGAGRKETCTNYNSIVMVTNTSKKLMDWLRNNFGGNYYKTPASGNCREAYRWRFLKHKETELLLLAVLPYLMLKKEQAIILLEFVRLPRTNNSEAREQLWKRIRDLNKRGISVETNTQDALENNVMRESELTGNSKSDSVVMQDMAKAIALFS